MADARDMSVDATLLAGGPVRDPFLHCAAGLALGGSHLTFRKGSLTGRRIGRSGSPGGRR
jgi:hypothetical protein